MITERLDERPGQSIDRSRTVKFTYNGNTLQCFQGDTVASALYSNGRRIFGRSFKYHRPRGLLCVAGRCPNCMMNIDGQPNAKACTIVAREGMKVEQQNAWPSLDNDLGSIIDRFSFLLPVGFYYKTLIHPKWIWPIARDFIRKAAGYGKVNTSLKRDSEEYEHDNRYVDVAIIGGGLAGLSAAVEASKLGYRVLLVDDQPQLGGRLRHRSSLCDNCDELSKLRGYEAATKLIHEISLATNVEILSNATCFGLYEENLLGIAQTHRLYRVRAKKIVISTGCFERPYVFTNNDLPGIFLGEGLQRLITLYGIKPGQKAVVVTNNNYGLEVLSDLIDAGVQAVALVTTDKAAKVDLSLRRKLEENGTKIFEDHILLEALGSKQVTGASIGRQDDHGGVVPNSTRTLSCDIIALSVGFEPANSLLYQGGCEIGFDEKLGESIISATSADIFAAGDNTGFHDLQITRIQGKLAGLQSAIELAHERTRSGTEVSNRFLQDCESLAKGHARRLEVLVTEYRTEISPGLIYAAPCEKEKKFACICEDQTYGDIRTAIDEGFDDIEPLKRYTTFTMGPCQGKMCSLLCTAIHANATGLDLSKIKRTTARPPYQPLTLGVLNGPPHRPVKLTALHHKHLALNAEWMDMGEWKRPKHYGSVEQEYRAIREKVGMIDVSTLGRFSVKGPDAGQFLDRVYTHVYSNLKVGKARYVLLLTEAGKVLDDGIAARISEEEFFVTSSTGNTDFVEEWLKWWQVTGSLNVTVTNVTSGLAAINVAGPKSRELLSKLADVDLSNEYAPYMSCVRAHVAGVPSIMLRIGFVGEVGWEIHFPAEYAEYLWEKLLLEGQPYGIKPVGVQAMRLLSLDKRHIWPTLDTDAASDALETDLGWAIKFEKHDFVGKHYLLKTKREGLRQRIVGFVVKGSGLAENGDVIVVNGKVVGRVTTAGYSFATEKCVGIAWVPIEFAKDGIIIPIIHDGRPVQGEVTLHAFYDPEGERMKY